jgi:biotin operon repressor
MSDKKITDEDLVVLLTKGLSQKAIAAQLGMAKSSINERVKRLIKKGYSPKHDMTHLVPDGFKVKGVSSLYNKYGQLSAQWVKSSEDKERQLEILTEMCQGFIQDLPKVLPVTISNENLINEDKLAVYPLGDPHIGMLSWAEETGDNWDLKIAEEVFCGIFDRVVKTAPRCKEALIVNLGDFFHVDNTEGTTSRSGNHLDKDGRYAKMIQIGVKIIRQMIATALQHHEIVTVMNVIGNHDDTGSVFLSIALKHIYENEPRVIINDQPSPFHYYKFGNVLIGAHHGHTCKMDKLPGVMAADKAKDWGDTQFRYWLTGHIHHDSKQEYPGCMVESFRTLAAKDAYATYGGWRAGQDTKCIVMHKLYGEIERHTINIAQL